MPDDACALPARSGDDEFKLIQRLVKAKRIAVVGLSDDPDRPSFGVAMYLLQAGKEIIPVNPKHAQIMGVKCYATLQEVPGDIDLVDVFRRPEYCPQIVTDAIRIRAKGVWLQSGIRSVESRKLALDAGLEYIEDRCLMIEHLRAK